jgi:feruloyl esterase
VALERWVEKGVAPSTIVATKYTGDGADRAATVTRPLCEFPQAARYRGTGNPNDAASFVCEATTR